MLEKAGQFLDENGGSELDGCQQSEVENVIDRLPETERWTHFYDGAKGSYNPYRQLDYILLSKSLANATAAKPVVERQGLTTKATRVTRRFKGVTARSEASDHCALAIDLEL